MTTETVPAELCWAEWAELPPGPELGFRLAIVDLAALADDELIEVMAAARRQTAWTQSVELASVAELARRRRAEESLENVRWTSSTHDRLVDEVAAELTIPSGAAQELVWLAEALTERHLRTWSALVFGVIDYRRAKVIAEALGGLADEPADRIESKIIAKAPSQTVTRLRALLKAAVKKADPAAAEEKKKAARRERRVESWENASGTADLVGRDLAAEDVEAIMNRLSAVARAMRADGDQRPVDAIRADLYRDLLRGVPLPEAAHTLYDDPSGEPSADAADAFGAGSDAGDVTVRPAPHDDARTAAYEEALAEVERLIAEGLATELGRHLEELLASARRDSRHGGRPVARALLISEAVAAMDKALEGLRDAWCAATGQQAHEGYRPPAAMRRRIERRHRTCVFPSCNRRAVACDIDHTRPYDPAVPRGGRTRADNLAPLCRRHHRTKQHRTWWLVQPFPGLLVWVTPAGRWHTVLSSPLE
ncbi:HNH endonuclease signature motif containing protein [Actinomadura sp. HBU206391]|uniref:HNH endonuclease signature motif containing protein n=1 Tax=Actinomadura sp. HBU206391 TaxID=2731692 RepID=UPI00164EFA9E|nr:HNH endonuclease signature motif containing protein [Actinomadura sp. HBU206391]MBC6460912.1 DUF222 domain-containing protein [Actinomadura sp. HBU206391]